MTLVFKAIERLVRVFDRANFSGDVGESLDMLLDKNLIFVETLFNNNTPHTYNVTNLGRHFLKDNFNDDEIVSYIKTMDDPTHLLHVIEGYLNKEKS